VNRIPATSGRAASAPIRLTAAAKPSAPAFQSSASSVSSQTRTPVALAAVTAWPAGVCAAAVTSRADVVKFCVAVVVVGEAEGVAEPLNSDRLGVPSPPSPVPSTEHCWPVSHSGVPPSSAPSGAGEFSSPLISSPSSTGQELPGAEQSMNCPSDGVASLRLAPSSLNQNIATPRASSGLASQWHTTYAGVSDPIRSLQLRGSSCE
jgi:hypothetical protein